jgi:hypothetical protein
MHHSCDVFCGDTLLELRLSVGSLLIHEHEQISLGAALRYPLIFPFIKIGYSFGLSSLATEVQIFANYARGEECQIMVANVHSCEIDLLLVFKYVSSTSIIMYTSAL